MQYCQLNCFFAFSQFLLDMFFAGFCNCNPLQLIVSERSKDKPGFFMTKKSSTQCWIKKWIFINFSYGDQDKASHTEVM